LKVFCCSFIKCDRRILALIFLFFWFVFHDKSGAEENPLPFQPGEKLTFVLKWSFIPAGMAVLEVLPIETIDGLEVFHFVLTARTNAFLDTFYKVRTRIDAFADVEMTHAVLYKNYQQEGTVKRKSTVTFNWQKKQAQYIADNEKKDPIDILPCSFDPLSILYRIRLFEMKNKQKIEHPVTDGKKCVIGKATVIRREKIKMDSGIYDTYLLEPEVKHVRGVFEKSENAKLELWVTADSHKLPVKVKSKVVVGSFVGELVSVEGIQQKP